LKYKVYIIGLAVSIFYSSCYKEEIIPLPNVNQDLILKIDKVCCAYDENTRTFFYAVGEDTLTNYESWIEYSFKDFSLLFQEQVLINDSYNNLGNLEINIPYRLETMDDGEEKDQYYLMFTLLPTIEVFIDEKIIDEPKFECYFRLNDPLYLKHNNFHQQFESYAGIEIRGGTSQAYPKKSYGLELWDLPLPQTKLSYPLLGMRNDDDWILDAMYIDEARMRNIVSFQIWSSMVQHENMGIKETSSINGEFVELFINDNYRGIYCLSEKIDRKQLNLDFNFYGEGGVLYKAEEWGNGVPTFYNYSDTSLSSVWSGWYQLYPDPDIFTQWGPLYNLIKFVVDSDNEEFREYITSYIDLQSFINYYIFLNIISGFDNAGKNTFLYKRTISSKFKIAPWDMDGTWGRNWDASLSNTSSILTNNLYVRLIETDAGEFNELCKKQWMQMRADVLTLSSLLTHFKSYRHLFNKSKGINRENERWNLSLDINSEVSYIESWTIERLEFLDEYFNNVLISL
jgi:hypothetical protein